VIQKSETFFNVCPFFEWLSNVLESCLILRTEMDNLPSNLTGSTMRCISIGWYPETRTFRLCAAANDTRSPQKATNWSGTKSSKPSKESKLSWYQSKDKKHFLVYVKFEVGLPILFTVKTRSKKVRFFSVSVPFFKWRGWKIKESELFENVNFWRFIFFRIAYFSKPRWATYHRIL
jgi:hypothetical protein